MGLICKEEKTILPIDKRGLVCYTYGSFDNLILQTVEAEITTMMPLQRARVLRVG